VSSSYALSSRFNCNFSSFYFRVGGSICPQKAVNIINTNVGGYCEAYMELIKCQHALSKANTNSILAFDVYNVADVGDTTVGGGGVLGLSSNFVGGLASQALVVTGSSHRAAFAIALEMEAFSGRGDILLSGANVLSQQIFFEYNILTAPVNAYTIDMYSNFDIIFVLENGLLSARY
jgi:hypothetical protein